MPDLPFSSCCGMYWVRYTYARDDLKKFVRAAGRPPYTKAQKEAFEKIKAVRDEALKVFKDHQADASLEHGQVPQGAPR